jgi:hypothetical protein
MSGCPLITTPASTKIDKYTPHPTLNMPLSRLTYKLATAAAAAAASAQGSCSAPVHDLSCAQSLQLRVGAVVDVARLARIHVQRQLAAERQPDGVKVLRSEVQQLQHIGAPAAAAAAAVAATV